MRISGRALDLGLAAFSAALLGASAWLTPAGDQLVLPGGATLGGLCWFRGAFHVDCPFCGTTRSFVALAHGDVAAAFRFHPAGPLLFAALAVALVALVTALVRRTRPLVERPSFLVAVRAVTVVCLSVGVVHVVKNVVMQMVRS
ncbi:MAG TPA: DUF2752 domain-containing protein [Kofleriaceae bacterium]|nr:DUF2752 domain-containing protein [Kofleriaceae bacterium]